MPEEVHLRRRIAVPAEDAHHHQQHQLPGEERGREPERQDLPPGQPDQRGQNVEPVRGGVEEPAEAADLVPAPGELAVEIVADRR